MKAQFVHRGVEVDALTEFWESSWPPALLTPGAVRIWFAAVGPYMSDKWQPALSDEDRVVVNRIRVDAASERIAARRALVRIVLGELTNVEPQLVRIDRSCERCGDSTHGRPRIDAHSVEFSASSTTGMVAVAVAETIVGLDIESCDRFGDADQLARVFLDTAELEAFHRLRIDDRPSYLAVEWTRREAALKASGLGLAGLRHARSHPTYVHLDGRDWAIDTTKLPGEIWLSLATDGPATAIDRVRYGPSLAS